MSEGSKSFIGSARVISVCTLLSRILGVVRDSVSAAFFGAGPIWDAFSFAFQIPNLFRKLFGEGALSAAFIPVFTEYIERKDEAEMGRMAGAVASFLAVVLLGLLLLGEGLCVSLLGTHALSEKWRLPLMLTVAVLPYSFLICMTALTGGILQSFKHFAAPALAPVILNLLWIVSIWLAAPLLASAPPGRAFVLTGGVLVAGTLQFLLQMLVLRRRGFRLRPHWEPGHPGLRRCLRSMAPIILGLAVFQVNVLMDGVIAVGLAGSPEGGETFRALGHTVRFPMEAGARSVLYYGDRLMQFPLGVFGIALATALFPTLSSHAAREDWEGFSKSLRDALAVVWFIGLPASVGLALLREPVIALIFQRGAFTREMTVRTGGVVLAYSCGIWAYCGLHVLIRAFYATLDTATPVRISACMVALNLTLNLALVWFLREAGMAAATAFCAAVQVVILVRILARRRRVKVDASLVYSGLKTLAATGLMVPACLLVMRLTSGLRGSFTGRALVTAGVIGAGMAVFFGVSVALRNEPLYLLLPRRLGGRRLRK